MGHPRHRGPGRLSAGPDRGPLKAGWSPMRGHPARLRLPHVGSSIAVLVMVIAMATAGGASARRPPTKSEATAISRALHASSATKAAKCFRVRDILISTVGPWARAKLVPCDPRHGDIALSVLRRRRGHWHVRDLGTSGVGCTVAPGPVRRDLLLVCP